MGGPLQPLNPPYICLPMVHGLGYTWPPAQRDGVHILVSLPESSPIVRFLTCIVFIGVGKPVSRPRPAD
jgi:hypothetical protein